MTTATATGPPVDPATAIVVDAGTAGTAADSLVNQELPVSKKSHKGQWNRQVHELEYRNELLVLFNWLRYDQVGNLLYCAPCRNLFGSENPHRAWASGVKDGRSWDKDKVKIHGNLSSHLQALAKSKREQQVPINAAVEAQVNRKEGGRAPDQL
jgi:hypothetical protein